MQQTMVYDAYLGVLFFVNATFFIQCFPNTNHKDVFARIFYLFTAVFHVFELYCSFQACWTLSWVNIY